MKIVVAMMIVVWAGMPCLAEAARFTWHADGTVSDSVTGLMWQRQDDGVPRTWKDSLEYCEGLSLAGYDSWRLPDIKELRSIVDNTVFSPAINTAVFPHTNWSGYWSSSSSADDTGGAWGVLFGNGYVAYDGKNYDYYVRCVR